MQIINSPGVNPPAGHYSHAVVVGDLVYVSGQLPFALNSSQLAEGAAEQTLQTLKNLEAILITSGSALDHLVSVQIMVSDIKFWPDVNQVYSQYLQNHKPARTIIPCGELHYGALVEISAVAQVVR